MGIASKTALFVSGVPLVYRCSKDYPYTHLTNGQQVTRYLLEIILDVKYFGPDRLLIRGPHFN